MYPQLMVIAMLADVALTALIGIGVYFGYSVYPASLLAAGAQIPAPPGFHASIPLWMPSIQDIKSPLSFLPAAVNPSVPLTLLLSVLVLIGQSYMRAIYLGGLGAVVRRQRPEPLLQYGRRYFKRMLGWSAIHTAVMLGTMGLGLLLAPIGVLAMLLWFFYSLTPYLIVLGDRSLSAAFSMSPSTMRRYFWVFFPFSLLALMTSGFISLFNQASPPYGYYGAMLVYAVVGTLLIGEFMRRLQLALHPTDGEEPFAGLAELIPAVQPVKRSRSLLATALLFVVPACGAWLAAGYHVEGIGRLLSKPAQEKSGISYSAGFSEALYASKQLYDTYDWNDGPYRLQISLPDLSGGRIHNELRGIATVIWAIKREHIDRTGSGRIVRFEEEMTEQKIAYRLVRTVARDGTAYYSSAGGYVSLLGLDNESQEPQALLMNISGDGSSVFIERHPSRFGQPSYRTSDDGRFFIPKTSRVNPDDFRTYWFAKELRQEDVLDLLAAKNKQSGIGPDRQPLQLAVALQEADGHMVKAALAAIAATGAKVTAPDWSEGQWSAYLRDSYKQADLPTTLSYLAKTGVKYSYEQQELTVPTDASLPAPGDSRQDGAPSGDIEQQPKRYRLQVPFPGKLVAIEYTMKPDGQVTDLELFPEEK
ncbi:hypothetical protein ACFFNY_18350 [Paenibacillus hodogayensis]|uniref:Uncharacterized protein n=1 Tax=Paenibacillus hodogayensis TaxID=279208 RepID=A0ABV5VZB4_9BACL